MSLLISPGGACELDDGLGVGEDPDEVVLRSVSRLSCSIGLVDQILDH